ncbi:GbsR/MarR family transcriptional regulator [Virgibacillus alimentarius]|uniref:HTH-type transcriptional regulator n=1 Tax=Virgibacillus alimentarius TaxID=698769 RepID=A0ABS4SBE6_9BACI|nr:MULTISPECIES: MarR family transcriptional regulator [Virgibacillus]MBP2258839.1 DNA-binding transcriptional regulator GbsR (MarR family) [Virgibacillus alimentarius]HLR65762.1 MarR family transcriptional regulator [Virgibacillus sp.]
MFENKTEITNKIIVEFSKTIEMFDLTPAEARLFTYLYLEEKPLTLDEMSEALGKSKTAMSNSIRNLANLNLVTRVWKRGVRKDLYKANTQLFKIFVNSYINKWIDATNFQKMSLAEIHKNVKQINKPIMSKEELATINNYLEELIEFHNEIESLFTDMKQD